MDKLLTKKDLAERWQVNTLSIDRWVRDGRLQPCNIPGDMRFNPDYIAQLEGIKIDRLSPIERRRLERENEELQARLGKVETALMQVQAVIADTICKKAEEQKLSGAL